MRAHDSHDVVGTGVDGIEAVAMVAGGGDDDDGNEPRQPLPFQAPAHVEAVAGGLAEVDEDEVGWTSRAGPENLFAGLHDRYMVTFAGEQALQKSRADVVVVRDEN